MEDHVSMAVPQVLGPLRPALVAQLLFKLSTLICIHELEIAWVHKVKL